MLRESSPAVQAHGRILGEQAERVDALGLLVEDLGDLQVRLIELTELDQDPGQREPFVQRAHAAH
jgi:hypothetical protein